MTHYETLGVAPNATDREIEKAYRRLASKHHPDRKGGDEAKFKEVRGAYEVLIDPEARDKYDKLLATQERPIESYAVEALVSMFTQYVAKGGEENPIDTIASIIGKEKLEDEGKITSKRGLIKSIEIKRRRVKKKTRGIDLYAAVCNEGVKFATEEIVKLERKIEIHNKALEILSDYDFVVDVEEYVATKIRSLSNISFGRAVMGDLST